MDILMPQLGETVTEGKIISWQRSVGDLVTNGDVLFEIETDKVSMDVPATCAGRIVDIRVNAGDTAPVGAIVAIIAGERRRCAGPCTALARCVRRTEFTSAPTSERARRPRPVPRVRPARRQNEIGILFRPSRRLSATSDRATASGVTTTPLARRLAATPASIWAPSTAADRRAGSWARIYRHGGNGAQVPAPAHAAGQTIIASHVRRRAVHRGRTLDGMRRTIASRLVESKQTVPHFYLVADVDIENMLAIRKTANLALPAKLSVNDFVVKAFAMALLRVPFANAIWAEDRILRFTRVDVGRRRCGRRRLIHSHRPRRGGEERYRDLRGNSRAGRTRQESKAQAA